MTLCLIQQFIELGGLDRAFSWIIRFRPALKKKTINEVLLYSLRAYGEVCISEQWWCLHHLILYHLALSLQNKVC